MFVRSRLGAASVLLIVSCAFAAEKKIQRSALPQAVDKAVEEVTKGATIRGFSMETENGKVEYEVEMTVNGHSKDVSIAKDGTVLEVEEEVAMDALPAAVRSALVTRAGTATIVMVESVSKAGKIVSYEADTLQGKKKAEIAVGPHGEKVGRGN